MTGGLILRSTKFILYTTLLRLVLTNGVETWAINKVNERCLQERYYRKFIVQYVKGVYHRYDIMHMNMGIIEHIPN